MFFGCSQNPKRTIEYNIKVTSNSLGVESQDTIFISKRNFNRENQVDTLLRYYPHTKDSIKSIHFYNENDQLVQILGIDYQSEAIDTLKYYYSDTTLSKTVLEIKNKDSRLIRIERFSYDSNDRLVKSLLSEIIIAESNDTVKNTLEEKTYMTANQIKQIRKIDSLNPYNSSKLVYEYKDELVARVKEYDASDSLIFQGTYEYRFDNQNNWIEQWLYNNDTLIFKKNRELFYK